MNKNTLIVLILILIVTVSGYFFVEKETRSNPDDGAQIISGNQAKAEELCGPQPPALCFPGAPLGCDTKSKKWNCYPEKKTEDSAAIDTSSWKTYRNEKYGFEVKYPEGADIKEKDFNVLSTYEARVRGIQIGSLTFISLSDQKIEQKAFERFKHFADIVGNPVHGEGGYVECSDMGIHNKNVDKIEVVYCDGEGGSAVYGIIIHGEQKYFVDSHPFTDENFTRGVLSTFISLN